MKRTILLTAGLVLCLSSLLIGAAAAQRATNAADHKVHLPFIFKAHPDYDREEGRVTNFRMSNSCGGPAVTRFPSGTSTVYVVFDYAYMEHEPLAIVIKRPGGAGNLYDNRDSPNIYVGSGTECIAISGSFPDTPPYNPYITQRWCKIGGVWYVAESIEWSVGD